MDKLIGKRIGPYEVRDLIGHGGMATVYRGYQANLNRFVAIKVLADWMSQDTQFVHRFRLEALAAGGLRHPNILTILDAGTFEGQHYIVMDYVPTGTLGDLMRNGPMSPDQAVTLTAQIADALDYVHRRGIVHRDMKPTNVLMDEDGRPLLADFGIAQAMVSGPRLTQTGSAVGTPEYMSPEQGQGARVDGRSDIYSLGIILYQMLTGKVPFAADTPMATLYQVVHQPPVSPRQVNPSIPPYLESIILKAIAKRPEDRFQTGGEMAESLRRRGVTPAPAKRGSTRLPAPASPPGGVTPAPRRRPLPLVFGGVIGLIAVIGISLLLSGLIRNEPRVPGNATLDVAGLPSVTETPPASSASLRASLTPVPATATPLVIEKVVTLPPTAIGEVLVTTNDEAQIFAGPDRAHPVLITVPKGQEVPVSGRTQDNSWWRITVAGITAWIANDKVMAPPGALALEVVSDVPTPPRPTDTPTPLPEPTFTTAPTPTPAPVQALVTAKSNANLRAGPGESYVIVGRAAAGQQFSATARTPANDWWQVAHASGSAWISSKVVTANAEVQKLPTVASPTQPPAPAQSTQQAATPPPRVFFDFEQFGGWRRGDEPNGQFTSSGEQKHSGATAGKLAYTIPNVDKNYVVFSRSPAVSIPAGAKALTLWVYGDNSGAFLNGWVQDAAGEVRAFSFGRVQHSGWKEMTAALDTTLPWPQGHVSGPDNGQLDPPLRFSSFVLDAEPVGAASGTIYLDDLGTGEAQAASATQPPGGGAAPEAPAQSQPLPSALSGHIVYSSGNTIYVVDAGTNAIWPLAANGRQPDIRGDGRVVYNGVGGGKDNLITVNLNGSLDNMVGAHPEDSYPHWSRTGDSAVFHSTLQGDGRQRIYIQRDMTHREEPGKLMVGNTEVFGTNPTWLKSWRIAFSGCDYWAAGSNCGIWTIDSNGGGQGVQLTQDVQDRSTDEFGGTVLYSSKATGNWDVWAVFEGGGAPRNLTSSPTQDAGATFAPDGRSIAFMSDRGGGWGIWVMNADGSNPQKLIDVQGGFGAWEEDRLAWGP